MRIFCSLIVFVLAGLGVASSAFAEPSASMDFYDKNYAQAPKLQIGSTNGNTESTAPNEVGPERQGNGTRGETTARTTVDPNANLDTVPAKYIELYVNSADAKHFHEVIRNAIALIKARKMPLRNIYHIGDYRNVTDAEVQQLSALGVHIQGSLALPEKLKVTESPVWVMSSDKGKYVVEGAVDLVRFLGASGEFSVPVPATPTPAGKMAGF